MFQFFFFFFFFFANDIFVYEYNPLSYVAHIFGGTKGWPESLTLDC